MIRRLLIRLVHARLDRGHLPGVWLHRQLAAHPDTQRRADALIDADQRLRAAGAAMRNTLGSPRPSADAEPAPAIAQIKPRPEAWAIAALLALAVSLLAFYAMVGPERDAPFKNNTRIVTSPSPPDTPTWPISLPDATVNGATASTTLDDFPGLRRVADRVAAGLGRLDTLDASAIQSAGDALAETYRSEADGLVATLAELLPAVQFVAETDPNDPAG